MISTLGLLIALSTALSMFYYWATAKNKWLKAAYIGAIVNGPVLIYVNWDLGSQTGDWAVNLFSILCVWIVISGVRGLMRLKAEQR
ncbi:MAG: hypothetical protein V3R57_02240 [Candidatus Bathyarchaeia archaeon]